MKSVFVAGSLALAGLFTISAARAELVDSIGVSKNTVLIRFARVPALPISYRPTKPGVVEINLHGAQVPANFSQVRGNGTVEGVYSGAFSKLVVNLTKPGSCALETLPLSKSVVLHTFRWDALSESDKMYYSGLLAAESGQSEMFARYMDAASERGHARASVHRGLQALSEGDFLRASSLLEKHAQAAGIPDAFAAMSQIRRSAGNIDEANALLARFVSAGGKLPASDVKINFEGKPGTQTIGDDEDLGLTLLSENSTAPVSQSLGADSSQTASVSKAADTALQARFSGIFEQKKAADQAKEPQTLLSSAFVRTSVFASIAFIISGSVYLFVLYRTWRKKHKATKRPAQAAPNATSPMAGETKRSFDVVLNDVVVPQPMLATVYGQRQEASNLDTRSQENASQTSDRAMTQVSARTSGHRELLERAQQVQQSKTTMASEEHDLAPQKLENGRERLSQDWGNEMKRSKRARLAEAIKDGFEGASSEISQMAKKLGVEKSLLEFSSSYKPGVEQRVSTMDIGKLQRIVG